MAATLLLADDSVTIQRVIELTFANEGIRVVTVADGNAATSLLQDERPDIILADVGLPAVDGYAIAERIKRSPAWSSIPVLLLTGAFEPIDEARARATGCDGVLVKPFEPHRLVGIVKGLLAGQRPDNLWPNDMPRVDAPLRPTPASRPLEAAEPVRAAHPGPGRPAPRPAGRLGDAVAEPGPLPPPSAVEEVFEIGLDDLDMAFSRLDPVAPPSRLDDDTVSDFQRDIQQLRNNPSAPPAAPEPPPPVSMGPALSHLPVEDATPIDAAEARETLDAIDLDWDLPTPATVIESAPVPADFPAAPAPPTPPTPPPPSLTVPAAPAPADSPVAAEPTPPTPLTPPAPPTPPPPSLPAPAAPASADSPVDTGSHHPTPPTPPTLASAFAALLAAEQAQPVAAKAHVPLGALQGSDVEEVVRRVVTRMTDEVVRKLVSETAERLIREEMDKLNR